MSTLFQDLLDDGENGHGRRKAERDFDEVIFSSQFRRLGGKAQIFPMLHDDSAHNRLVHSLECASVGRSLGRQAAARGGALQKAGVLRLSTELCAGDIAATVATAALTHDIGNPPFGHSGEAAIRMAFEKVDGSTWYDDLDIEVEILTELRNIDGNAIGLHTLLRDLTLSPTTVMAATKRPRTVGKGGKFCVLSVDIDRFNKRAQKAGIQRTSKGWDRHPLSYLMEAADDICYLVMDAVDAVNLGVIPEAKCRKYLEGIVGTRRLTLEKLRDATIGRLVELAGVEFENNIEPILAGEFESTLVESLDGREGGTLARLRAFEERVVYSHRPVLQMEIAGYEVLQTLVESFGRAAAMTSPSGKEKKLRKLMPQKIQDRLDEEDSPGNRVMEAVCYIAGMTDRYAYELCQTLQGVRLPHMLP